MRYVLRNIKNLAKNEKFIFAVMLICIFASAWIMTFSYGLYQNYFSLRNETEIEGKELDLEVAEGANLTKSDLVRYFDAISDETLNSMDLIYTCAPGIPEDEGQDVGDGEWGLKWGYVYFRFAIYDGRYKTSDYVTDIWESQGLVTAGRYISDEEEAEGANVALVHKTVFEGFDVLDKAAANGVDPPHYSDLDFIKDTSATRGELTVFGKRYKIIGAFNSGAMVIVPFLSVPDEQELIALNFIFKNNITNLQYNELMEQANAVIPGKLIFPELDIPDEESIYLYNNIMLISALIAALTIINFAFLYNFIFQKRRRQLAVMRICGCTGFRALRIYLAECCLICIPTFLIGIAAYIPFMHGVLSDLFVYMEASYSPMIYIAIFAIYVVTLFIIMGAMLLRQIKRETVQAWKGGDN